MNRIKSTFTADAENESVFDNNFAMTYPFLTRQSREKNELIHQYRGGGTAGVGSSSDPASDADSSDVVVSNDDISNKNNKAEWFQLLESENNNDDDDEKRKKRKEAMGGRESGLESLNNNINTQGKTKKGIFSLPVPFFFNQKTIFELNY